MNTPKTITPSNPVPTPSGRSRKDPGNDPVSPSPSLWGDGVIPAFPEPTPKPPTTPSNQTESPNQGAAA